jgi:hypothetical protein
MFSNVIQSGYPIRLSNQVIQHYSMLSNVFHSGNPMLFNQVIQPGYPTRLSNQVIQSGYPTLFNAVQCFPVRQSNAIQPGDPIRWSNVVDWSTVPNLWVGRLRQVFRLGGAAAQDANTRCYSPDRHPNVMNQCPYPIFLTFELASCGRRSGRRSCCARR